MGTGASKAKREAKKQAAAAYYKALKESKRAERLSRIDAQSSRKISDQLGEDMSYQSKRLAQKADKVGREINARGIEFNAGVDKYNRRWDTLQRQMASPTGVSKDAINYAKDMEPGMRQEFSRIDAEIAGLRAQEEGLNKSQPMQPVYGLPQNRTPLTEDQRARAARISELQQERDSIDMSSRGINNSYRNLENLESAYNDLSNLSKESQGYKAKPVQNSDAQLRSMLEPKAKDRVPQLWPSANDPTAAPSVMGHPIRARNTASEMELDPNAAGALVPQFAEQYKALGDKLKQNLARDQRMAMPKQKPGGLLAAELMSGAGQVDKEVIG